MDHSLPFQKGGWSPFLKGAQRTHLLFAHHLRYPTLDTIIINEFIAFYHSKGFVQRKSGMQEFWGWGQKQIEEHEGGGVEHFVFDLNSFFGCDFVHCFGGGTEHHSGKRQMLLVRRSCRTKKETCAASMPRKDRREKERQQGNNEKIGPKEMWSNNCRRRAEKESI